MPADIINLRSTRKAKARVERQREAETNRALFGRTKAEKKSQADERKRTSSALDAHRRDRE